MQFQLDGIYNCPLAHRLHNAGGSQNRNAADDADFRIKRTGCNRFPSRNGDRDSNSAGVGRLPADRLNRLGDHLPRNAVDRRRSDRLIQSGFCHPSHAGSSFDRNTGFFYACSRYDFHAVRDISIVSGVFDNCAPCRLSVPPRAGDRNLHRNPFCCDQRNRFRGRSGKQQRGSCGCRQCGAGAGRITTSQLFLTASDIVGKSHCVILSNKKAFLVSKRGRHTKKNPQSAAVTAEFTNPHRRFVRPPYGFLPEYPQQI